MYVILDTHASSGWTPVNALNPLCYPNRVACHCCLYSLTCGCVTCCENLALRPLRSILNIVQKTMKAVSSCKGEYAASMQERCRELMSIQCGQATCWQTKLGIGWTHTVATWSLCVRIAPTLKLLRVPLSQSCCWMATALQLVCSTSRSHLQKLRCCDTSCPTAPIPTVFVLRIRHVSH